MGIVLGIVLFVYAGPTRFRHRLHHGLEFGHEH
jgi:hypothetical protein